MVHHLWRAIEQGNERILLVVGTGHIRVLRHLLDETPMCCPVSPLPHLPER
jgi:pheromone shutdown protein TraB